MGKKIMENSRPKKTPITVNENGEVVFTQIDEANGRRKRRNDKPTPLMLCNEISKIFRNTLRENESDQRVQGSYRDILFHLAREDGRTQLELAHLTHLKPPTISVALVKLENEGYVIRKSDPMDARRTRVYLTDKGKAIDEKAWQVIQILDSRAIKGFSDEEYKQLMLLLYKLRENVADGEE